MPTRPPNRIQPTATAGALFFIAALLSALVGNPGSLIQMSILIACVLALAVLLAVTLKRLREAVAELEEIRATLDQLQPEKSSEQSIVETINKMTQDSQERIANLHAETGGLKAILAAMEEGIIVIDSQKRVLVANRAARKILNIASEPVGKPLSEATRFTDLLANMEMSVDASQACGFEFQIPNPEESGKRFIMARCAPVHDEAHKLAGAVAVLHDMSDLRRLERMRTEFVANVSHELRTPLTSLLGYLETLEHGTWENPEQAQQFLKICHRQAENLSRIVEDLLRLSRLENPQQEVANTEFSECEIDSLILHRDLVP